MTLLSRQYSKVLCKTCRIRSREQYQDFLKCLNLFAQEIIAKTELQIMVQDILGRYPDLLVRPAGLHALQRNIALF